MCFKAVPAQDVTNTISLSSFYWMYDVPLLIEDNVEDPKLDGRMM